MFQISKRQAKIGMQIQNQGENHGKDKVVCAYRIPIKEVLLTKDDLNELMGDTYTHHCLFTNANSELLTPRFPQLKPFELKHEFQNGAVTIKYGLENEIQLTACKINKIILTPKDGGMCEISFTVHTVPTLDLKAALLTGQVGHEVEIEIKADLRDEDAQKELPLNTIGEGEQAEQAA